MPAFTPPAPNRDDERPRAFRVFWSKRRIGIAGTVLLIFLGAGIWYAAQPESPTPLDSQRRAIELLESGKNSPKNRRTARNLALSLQEKKFHDPDFPGASEYILGIVAFREGRAADESKREEHFAKAVEYLRDAERLALNSQYRPEWAYALGSSLHALGSPSDARPYIEEALDSRPGRQRELTRKLIEIYLELKAPALEKEALRLAEDLLDTLEEEQAEAKDVDLAKLLKAQVLVALGRTDDALQVLPELDANHEAHTGMQIIQSQTLMGLKTRGGYERAREILQTLLQSSGVTDSHARQAHFLLGVCEEFLGDADRAIRQYERTKSRYLGSHEGVAAALRQARLLQREGRDEESLAAFESALNSVSDPENYHNRWIGIEKFRSNILLAWNSWIESDEFPNAIALAKLMPPLFSDVQASELQARAFEKWAESYEEKNSRLVLQDPQKYKRESRERWNASGDAYAALAELLKTSPKYSDVLWKSAEHYIRGYRFRKAKAKLQICLEAGPKERQPLAAVQLAYTKLNNGDTESALELLKRTIREYPKDPASFRASYLLGITHLENNKYQKAQETWREILESSHLGPMAKEWRDSLLALGSTLYHVTSAETVAKKNLEAEFNQRAEPPDERPSRAKTGLDDWDEAISKLSEYVRRYPASPKHLEAQYLLARSYQKSASEYQAKLENAQIANEKSELAEEYQKRLKVADRTLTELRRSLLRQDEMAGLTPFLARLLRNTYFDLGDVEFALQDYDNALQAYSSAINRYPNDVRVLLSYMQMTECYEQLNKSDEAISTLKQANVIAQRMDDSTFDSKSTSLRDKQQWAAWFDWKLKMMDDSN